MSRNHDLSVSHCVVVLTPRKRDEEGDSAFLESSTFIFQSSECHLRLTYGWESKERKMCKVYIKSNPLLFEKFYLTVYIFKGKNSILFPKSVVLDPTKCIWSAPFSAIEKQIPFAEKCNINFRFSFTLLTDYGPSCTPKRSVHTFAQTSSCFGENEYLKLSDDFGRLFDGVGGIKYDIEVKSGDVVIRAHKCILCARSEFFRRKLQSLTENHIELHYIDPAAFHEIMRDIYTGKSPDLSLELAKKIYKAGDICSTDLRQRCVDFVIDNLTVENACDCLTLSDDEYFRNRIISFIIEKGILFLDEYWKPFMDEHPKHANDVYYRYIKTLPPSKS